MKERNFLEGIAEVSNFWIEYFYIRFKNEEWLVYVHNAEDQLTVGEYIKSQQRSVIETTIQHKGREITCFRIHKKEILTWIQNKIDKTYRYHLIFHRKIDYCSEWLILKPTDKVI